MCVEYVKSPVQSDKSVQISVTQLLIVATKGYRISPALCIKGSVDNRAALVAKPESGLTIKIKLTGGAPPINWNIG